MSRNKGFKQLPSEADDGDNDKDEAVEKEEEEEKKECGVDEEQCIGAIEDEGDLSNCKCKKKKKIVLRPSPPYDHNILSQITFWPIGRLVSRGNDHPLTSEELFGLPEVLSSDYAHTKFCPPMMDYITKHSPPGTKFVTKRSIAYAIVRYCFKRWLVSFFLSLCSQLLRLVVPYLIEDLVAYFDDESAGWLPGLGYAGLIVGVSFITAICMHYGDYIMRIVSVGVRHSLQRLIYDKTLRMRVADIPNPGRCVNLLSTDAQAFMDSLGAVSSIITAPVYLAVAAALLYRTIGWVGIVGFFIASLMLPVSLIIMRIIARNTRVYKARTDRRLRLIDELLHGIRIIKYYVWERPFLHRIDESRRAELDVLLINGLLRTCNMTLMRTGAPAATFLTFLIQASVGQPVTPGNVFTTFATFNTVREPFMQFGRLFNQYAQWKISLGRICDYLNLPEMSSSSLGTNYAADPLHLLHKGFDDNEQDVLEDGVSLDAVPSALTEMKKDDEKSTEGINDVGMVDAESVDDSFCVEIHNGDFVWSDGKPAISGVELTVGKEELVMVIGSVGSGKSALVYSILSEVNKAPGSATTVKYPDSVSYVPQTPWILNKTLRDNILFGKEYDEELYHRVIQACCLEDDIRIFPGGDLCEIGERGITLSGGQKQRVSLARACYTNNSLFLLDDPLSALDMHVGAAVMEKCINGLMKGHPRVLVTNQLNYLNQADKIIVLENQRISFTGTYDELTKSSIDLSSFLTSPSSDENEEQDKEKKEEKQHDNRGSSRGGPRKMNDLGRKGEAGSKLMQKETTKKGTVAWNVVKHYAKMGGIPLLAFIGFGYINRLASSLGYSIALSRWSTASKSGCGSSSSSSSSSLLFSSWFGFDFSSSSESSLLSSSDCAGDAEYYMMVQGLLLLYEMVSISGTAFLWMVFGRTASRKIQNKFIDSITFAPTSFYDTTPLGRLISRFSVDFNMMDFNLPMCIQFACNQVVSFVSLVIIISLGDWWMCMLLIPLVAFYYWRQRRYRKTIIQIRRIEGLSRSPIYVHFDNTLSGLACIRAYRVVPRFRNEFRDCIDENARVYQSLFLTNQWYSQRLDWLGGITQGVTILSLIAAKFTGNLDIGFTALAIANMSQITGTLGGLSRTTAEVEQAFQAVERIEEYCYLDPEGKPDNTEVDDQSWPQDGKIVFDNVSARYRPDLPLVVKNVSFTIEPKKKIGVVGRTGSGKSTLLQLLYRMIEADAGNIFIDGVNIGDVKLDCLRSKLSIIPQEPTLFHGSVRYNLDPLEQCSDEELWQCLELANLRPVIEAMDGGLEATIAEHGENMSVGQRQLMCMARAILRRTRILVMDEATASVDIQTDQVIQSMIQRQFTDCTVLTIAHRLHTVMNCDEILVLDDGHVVEHGTPSDLLAANGVFAGLVASAHDGALYDQISQHSESLVSSPMTTTTTAISPSLTPSSSSAIL